MTCCHVVSLISIDERGQMILPKDVREKAHIQPGDKLALLTWEKEGAICCLALIKADELMPMLKDKLGPIMSNLNTK
jgi:antitoxin PrlF